MDEKLAAAINDAKNQQARGPGAICFLQYSTWDVLIAAARSAPAPTLSDDAPEPCAICNSPAFCLKLGCAVLALSAERAKAKPASERAPCGICGTLSDNHRAGCTRAHEVSESVAADDALIADIDVVLEGRGDGTYDEATNVLIRCRTRLAQSPAIGEPVPLSEWQAMERGLLDAQAENRRLWAKLQEEHAIRRIMLQEAKRKPVLPREPTSAMMLAGYKVLHGPGHKERTHIDAWYAMYDAACKPVGPG